jgi:hypothetical protein
MSAVCTWTVRPAACLSSEGGPTRGRRLKTWSTLRSVRPTDAILRPRSHRYPRLGAARGRIDDNSDGREELGVSGLNAWKRARPRFAHAMALGAASKASSASKVLTPQPPGISLSPCCALSTPAQQCERQHRVRNRVRPRPPLHRSGRDLLCSRLVASQDGRTRPTGRTHRCRRSTGAAGSTASRAGSARASPSFERSGFKGSMGWR